MGRRGPARKKEDLNELEGNPGKRKATERAMTAPIGAPNCPSWLNKDAQAEWKRIVPLLVTIGSIAKVDRTVLALYCQAYARWKQAEEYLDDTAPDLLGTNRHGEDVLHPLARNRFKCWEQCKAALDKLGLSPADRARIDLPLLNAVDNKDPIEDLLD